MIGKKIKYYRIIQNLTRREVAASAGMHESTLRKIECYGVRVFLDTAKRIASALDISIDELAEPVTECQWKEALDIRRRRIESKHELQRQQRNEKRRQRRASRTANAG